MKRLPKAFWPLLLVAALALAACSPPEAAQPTEEPTAVPATTEPTETPTETPREEPTADLGETPGETPALDLLSDSQTVLYEIEYMNFAWIPTWVGVVIDREGNIFQYEIAERTWEPADSAALQPAELADKYGPSPLYIGTVDPARQDTLVKLLGEVRGGKLVEADRHMADAGQTTFYAYQFDEATNTYEPIILRTEGDRTVTNSDPVADDLVALLRDIVRGTEAAAKITFFPGDV